MSSVSSTRYPHSARVSEDRVNLFLLPSKAVSNTADGSNVQKSGMLTLRQHYISYAFIIVNTIVNTCVLNGLCEFITDSLLSVCHALFSCDLAITTELLLLMNAIA